MLLISWFRLPFPIASRVWLTLLLGLGLRAAAIPNPPVAPGILQFSAQPARPEAGQSTTLTWLLTGGAPTRLTLTAATGAEPPINLLGRSALGGLKLTGRPTFLLTASNAWGSSSASLTVIVRGLSLLAGDLDGPGCQDGQARKASFRAPQGLAQDGAGNLIVADTGNQTIRRIGRDGQVSTVAGTPGQTGFQDGPGSAARFKDPGAVAVDPVSGTIYVADAGNSVIRSIAADGRVATLAGAPGQEAAQDGLGAAARFDHPQGLALAADGCLYVADTGNQRIRKVATDTGQVSTVAGTAEWGYRDGPAASAAFASPMGIAVDADQTLYVADTFNNAIRRIANGSVSTLVGFERHEGDQDGPVAQASLRWPMAILVDAAGQLLICDSGNGRIRILGPDGLASWPGPVLQDPAGLALDAQGALLVAETGASLIQRWTPAGSAQLLAGTPAGPGAEDPAGAARFQSAAKIVVDAASGDALVSDPGTGLVRRISPAGATRPLEGLHLADGGDGQGLLRGLAALALDGDGALVGANLSWSTVLRADSKGLVTVLADARPTVAGLGAEAGRIPFPTDLAVDHGGRIFVTDAMEDRICLLRKDGGVLTFAGRQGQPGAHDGSGEDAQFSSPTGIAVAADDSLIVADRTSHTIRRISATGYVTTLAGKAREPGSDDGLGGSARFRLPQGVAVDGRGNIFVADTGNDLIRKIAPDGQVTTVAGTAGRSGTELGPLPGSLNEPTSLAVTPAGDLLVLCARGVVRITDP